MARRKHLSQRQLTVLDDLFNSDLDEQVVLDKHRVRRSTYDRWLADKLFAERFKQYVNGLRRRSELLMAKYSCLAAAKLVELTASDKAETARKACLDILSPPCLLPEARRGAKRIEQSSIESANGGGIEHREQLPPQTVSRLLAALAEEKEQRPVNND